MRTRILIFVLVLVLLFSLTGCSGTSRNEAGDVNYRQGTKGLEMRLMDANPPYQVYEHDILPITIEMFNRGVSPITDGELYITGYDPNIINNNLAGNTPGNLPAYEQPHYFSITEAKSQFNKEGGYDVLEFNSGDINLPYGTTTYDVPLVIYACYTYETVASGDICVDPEPHRSYTDKACTTQNVGMGGGQGAPVAVSYIDVTNMRDQIRLTFTINNVGGGTVIDQDAFYNGACPTGFSPKDINVVDLERVMLGTLDITTFCAPTGRIKLNEGGMGKISCTAPIGGTTAFKTPVEIALSYAYKDNIKKNIQIKGYN